MKSSITPTLAHPLMSNFFNSEEEPVLTHWLHHGFVCECIQNTNNSTTYSCPPSPRKEEINSVCTYMHVSVSVYVCVCVHVHVCVFALYEKENIICFEVTAAQSSAVLFTSILPFPWLSLCLPLLSSLPFSIFQLLSFAFYVPPSHFLLSSFPSDISISPTPAHVIVI